MWQTFFVSLFACCLLLLFFHDQQERHTTLRLRRARLNFRSTKPRQPTCIRSRITRTYAMYSLLMVRQLRMYLLYKAQGLLAVLALLR